MLLKNQIKYINSLRQKKHREEHGLFVAEGNKMVEELLASEITVKQIFAIPGFFQRCDEKALIGVECIEVKGLELERISGLHSPNQVIAVCEIPGRSLNVDGLCTELTLVLDDIRDPGNLGTIIRIADWFGIENIICSNETVDVYNPKVVQSTMGSIARIKIHYVDLPSFFENLKQKNPATCIYGAVLNGENVFTEELVPKGFIVIGNESNGISNDLLPYISHKISIPSYAKGASAESLNAAIATAIICAEFRRSA